jgi:hypothetical protein
MKGPVLEAVVRLLRNPMKVHSEDLVCDPVGRQMKGLESSFDYYIYIVLSLAAIIDSGE